MIKRIKHLWSRIAGNSPPVVKVLRLSGAIGMRQGLNRGLSLATSAASIDKLFADKSAVAAAVIINSPGGSPVQSVLIHDRLRALSAESGIKLMTFAEDVAASGGYMLALAGDEIYAHENSIIGSIGVVSAGFGFQRLIDKIGVDRRVYTSGESKAMLDPFKPEDPRDVAHLAELQSEVHESFKSMVRARRAGKLKGEEADLFTGKFWTGRRALDLGLIDGLDDVRSVCRRKFGKDVELELVHAKQSWFRQERPGVSIGPEFAEGLTASLEERALWARFGL